MGLLTSVQQVNSLEPRAVLAAVADGLRGLGLADVEVPQINVVAGVARPVGGATDLQAEIEPEVSRNGPHIQQAFVTHEPVVVSDA